MSIESLIKAHEDYLEAKEYAEEAQETLDNIEELINSRLEDEEDV